MLFHKLFYSISNYVVETFLKSMLGLAILSFILCDGSMAARLAILQE